jgi:hypothetical protein
MANKIPINWKSVDDLLIAGCSGVEIAANMGIHFDTLYDRTREEKGVPFSLYSLEKRQKGDSLLRAVQFAKAMKQDNMMLIWLGKNRLKQTDGQQLDKPENDLVIGSDLEIAKLKAENAELKRIMNESKAGIEHIPSEQAPEHMVRGSEVGEDL